MVLVRSLGWLEDRGGLSAHRVIMRESSAAYCTVTHKHAGLLLLYDEIVIMMNIVHMLIFLFVLRICVHHFDLFGCFASHPPPYRKSSLIFLAAYFFVICKISFAMPRRKIKFLLARCNINRDTI
jgi:hypothetical protein